MFVLDGFQLCALAGKQAGEEEQTILCCFVYQVIRMPKLKMIRQSSFSLSVSVLFKHKLPTRASKRLPLCPLPSDPFGAGVRVCSHNLQNVNGWELPFKTGLKKEKYKHRESVKSCCKPHWISLLIGANLNIVITLSGHWDIQCVLLLPCYYYGLLPRTSFCRLGTKKGSPLPLCRKH